MRWVTRSPSWCARRRRTPRTWSARGSSGASGYVVKPFDIDRLIDAVLEATGRSRRMQTGRASDLAIERPDLA